MAHKEHTPMVSWDKAQDVGLVEGTLCQISAANMPGNGASGGSDMDVYDLQLTRTDYPEGYSVLHFCNPRSGARYQRSGVSWSALSYPGDRPVIDLGNGRSVHDVFILKKGTQTTIKSQVRGLGSAASGVVYINPDPDRQRFYMTATHTGDAPAGQAASEARSGRIVIDDMPGYRNAEITLWAGPEHDVAGKLSFRLNTYGEVRDADVQNGALLKIMGVEVPDGKLHNRDMCQDLLKVAGATFGFSAEQLDLPASAANIYAHMGRVGFNPLQALIAKA